MAVILVLASILVGGSNLSRPGTVSSGGVHADSTMNLEKPVMLESNYTMAVETVEPYSEISSLNQRAAPRTTPIIGEMVTLTVSNSTIVKEFNITSPQAFLAIDGSSQSEAIPVMYTVVYPDGKTTSFKSTVNNPFHLFLANPQIGVYKVKLSTVNPGNTTAWIQVVSLESGTISIDTVDKEWIHLASGQAMYFKINKTKDEWILIYATKLAGASITLTLRHLPNLTRIWRESLWENYERLLYFYSPSKLSPGEYLLAIRNRGHTDLSIMVAKPSAVTNKLSVNKGRTIMFKMPTDIFMAYIDIQHNGSWLGFDVGLDCGGQGHVWLLDPEYNVIFSGSLRKTSDLLGSVWEKPRTGRYLLLAEGINYPRITVKLVNISGVEDLSSYKKMSRRYVFSQSGQAVYVKILGNNTPILLFANNATWFSSYSPYGGYWRISLISPEGKVLAEREDNYFGTAFPTWILSKYNYTYYYLRIQSEKGFIVFHYRAVGAEDYNASTPGFFEVHSKLRCDAVFINVDLRRPAYYYLWYVPLVRGAKIWVFNETRGVVGFSYYFGSKGWLWRVGHELKRPPTRWTIVVLSNLTGPAARLSHISSGDENLVIPPYNDTFNPSTGALIGLKIMVENGSNWLLLVPHYVGSFSVHYVFLDPDLSVKDPSLYDYTTISGAERERFEVYGFTYPSRGYWITLIAVGYVKELSLELSVLSKHDLLGNFMTKTVTQTVTQTRTQTTSLTKTLITTTSETITITAPTTLTETVANTRTYTQIVTRSFTKTLTETETSILTTTIPPVTTTYTTVSTHTYKEISMITTTTLVRGLRGGSVTGIVLFVAILFFIIGFAMARRR